MQVLDLDGPLLRRLLDAADSPQADVEDQRLLVWITMLTRAVDGETRRPLLPRRRRRPLPLPLPYIKGRGPLRAGELAVKATADMGPARGERFRALMQEVRSLYEELQVKMPAVRLSSEERLALRQQVATARGALAERLDKSMVLIEAAVTPVTAQIDSRESPPGRELPAVRPARISLKPRALPVPQSNPAIDELDSAGLDKLDLATLERELSLRMADFLDKWGHLLGPKLPVTGSDLRKMVRLHDRADRFERALLPLERAIHRLYLRSSLALKFAQAKIDAVVRRDPRLRRKWQDALRDLPDPDAEDDES